MSERLAGGDVDDFAAGAEAFGEVGVVFVQDVGQTVELGRLLPKLGLVFGDPFQVQRQDVLDPTPGLLDDAFEEGERFGEGWNMGDRLFRLRLSAMAADGQEPDKRIDAVCVHKCWRHPKA